MKTLEQELKLELTSKQYNELVAKSGTKGVEQVNYYFYRDGMDKDYMLRVRKKHDKYCLTLKVRCDYSKDIMRAEEYSAELSSALANALIDCGINDRQLRSLLGVDTKAIGCANTTFRCCGTLTTLRTVWTTADGLNVELDKNYYLGTCDYELECESDNIAKLQQLKDTLQKQGITIQSSVAKSERFFERLAGIPMPL